MKSHILIVLALAPGFLLTGCTGTGKLKCPDLIAKKSRPVLMARQPRMEHKKHRGSETQTAGAANAVVTPDIAPANEKLFKIKLPGFAANRLDEQDINDVNVYFKSRSQNGISLVKKENNKVYFEAKSPLEFIRVAESMAFKKASPAAPGGGGGMAIASGVLGIVGFLCALGPFIGFFAFVCALLAIILGAISLHSRRRGWAITGIVLGAITLALAALFIRFVYFRFL